jgi:hypothetical protein
MQPHRENKISAFSRMRARIHFFLEVDPNPSLSVIFGGIWKSKLQFFDHKNIKSSQL